MDAVRQIEKRGWIQRREENRLNGQLWQRQTFLRLRADVINHWIDENLIISTKSDLPTAGESEDRFADSDKTRARQRKVDPKTKEVGCKETGTTNKATPPIWNDAIDLEVERELRKGTIRNPGGFRAALLARYRNNDGPGQDVLDELDRRREAAAAVAAAKATSENQPLDPQAMEAGRRFRDMVKRRLDQAATSQSS